MNQQVIFLSLLLHCILNQSFAQTVKSDSSLHTLSLNHVIQVYHESIAGHSHLYNGSEYVNYDNHIAGHQFFESDVLEEGSISYEGVLYQNVPMQYDVMKDEVVIEHFHKFYKIKLLSERIDYFSLLDHTFIRMEQDSFTNTVLKTGFYDKLYDGKVKLLIKRAKTIEEVIERQRLNAFFVQIDRYFIYKDSTYHAVKNKKSVMRLFEDHKKEIRRFLTDNHINFKENRELAIIKMTQYYDKLIQ